MPPTSFPGQKSDSPQTVLCNVTQFFARWQIVNVFDATHSKRVAQKIRLTKRGLMRINGFGSGYFLNVAKRKHEEHVCV